MDLLAISDAIADLPVSVYLGGVSWFVPMVQSVHILGVALAFTSATLISWHFFVLANMSESAVQFSRRFLPWIYFSLLILFLSGSLLVLIEPHRELLNWYFNVKMFLVSAFLILITFGIREFSVVGWSIFTKGSPRFISQVFGVSLVGFLLAIIWCGRWIAYTQ